MFCRKKKGKSHEKTTIFFVNFDCFDAVLTGVESRTSSPIRVVRDETFKSITFKNLYPCGEGCGYAGGITSAGADGKKVAKALAVKYGLKF